MRTSTIKSQLFALGLSVLALACGGNDGPLNSGAPLAPQEVFEEPSSPEVTPEEAPAPVVGAKIDAMDSLTKERFERLVDSLPSACGKGHSLRVSRNTDATCKRAPFAVDYVSVLLADGATDEEVKQLYALRFREEVKLAFQFNPNTPHTGPDDAAVKVVEFYDYGCPACARFHPILEEALVGLETKVAVYFKQFPLTSHVDSFGAAQAALAAHKQGKFPQMHHLLFTNQHEQKMADLTKYAESIGLDMKKWKADFKAVEPLVKADRQEGDDVQINGTPSIYIDGIAYEGPSHPKYFKMWLEEALAGAR